VSTLARILIVEDEYPINNLISKNLTLTGHECLSAYDGLSAIELIQSTKLDLIILDVMLPGLSGFDLIKLIGDIPVIFVTAKSGLEDRLKGLSLGADDYIVKPFAMQELLARVSVVLRRTKRDDNTISFDGLTVDMGSRKVYRGSEKINLTPKEYALLEVLITHRNLALSREKLISMVWTYDYEGDTRTVDVHIQQLRQKLGLKDRIKTIYKVGYRLEL
jgi:DNA-binding response OmpR family regulator